MHTPVYLEHHSVMSPCLQGGPVKGLLKQLTVGEW